MPDNIKSHTKHYAYRSSQCTSRHTQSKEKCVCVMHETCDLEEQLQSRDEQLADGRQVVFTEMEDATDDQRMEEELDYETVGGKTEDETDDGGDDVREDGEQNEEEDDEMNEEESDGKERD